MSSDNIQATESKSFFKSVWFKCVAVLLVIAVVAGGLLALLNDLLFVSAEERTARAIKKIYGSEQKYSVILDVDNKDSSINTAYTCAYGKVEKVYVIDKDDEFDTEFDYLFRSTGNNGYKNGTVTVWVRVSVKGSDKKIEKVIQDGFEKQTLMSKLSNGFYDNFLVDITNDYDKFKAQVKGEEKLLNPVTGATKSATAGCNAVNAVINYLGEQK